MTSRFWYAVAVTITAGAGIIAGEYPRDVSRGANNGDVRGSARAYAQSKVAGQFHFPSSGDKVSIAAWIDLKAAPLKQPAIMVRLNIKKGWHVNATPASLPFLIPTTVKARIDHKDVKLDITYPPGRDSHIKLDGKSVLVYDDHSILQAGMPSSTLAMTQSGASIGLVVTVQSCSNKGICLPPAQLRSTVAAHL
ncbi:MAG: hypothetical protein HIU92_19430 [Proteobacteria bacterium]|nr:hypothetical protein [Pseudomonadota bacterium]